jgi:hypothetical protein
MMADEFRLRGKRVLTVVGAEPGEGEACGTCRSNEWIWDEEIALVRAMNGIKQKVRDARGRRDDAAIAVLRAEFMELRGKMERVRRQRLDSLGHFDYD